MAELQDQLIHKYEKLLLEAKSKKPASIETTIFDTAFRKHHENPTTELLKFFLDPNEKHDLGITFYNGFIDAIKSLSQEFENYNFGNFQKIGSEQIVSEKKRIDLWIETDCSLIIIEVKINNIQNNPVKNYAQWGKDEIKYSKKDLIKLVLNIDGVSQFKNWYGISFKNIAVKVRSYLAITSIEKPINKWIIFARDFLLHLDNFYDLMETDMKVIDFIIKNNNDIQQLFLLREQAYSEIFQHIIIAYSENFEQDTYKFSNDLRFKKECKGWRFSNSLIKSDSDIVLFLYFDTDPIAEIWLCFDLLKKDSSIRTKLDSKLKRSKFKEYIDLKKSDLDTLSNPRFRSICWIFQDFDLDKITQLIIQNQKILNEFEG